MGTKRRDACLGVWTWAVIACVLLQAPVIVNFMRGPTQGAASSCSSCECREVSGDDEAPQQHVFRPLGIAHYGFVQFSAYRRCERNFMVVGITSVAVREYQPPVQECFWKRGKNSSAVVVASTRAEVMYISFDENGALFVPAIVNCTFPQDVAPGGFLLLSVGAGSRGKTATVVALEEEEEGEAENGGGFREEKRKKAYAFCGPPMHSSVRVEWILQWLVYHNLLWEGEAHFFLYNVGGLDPQQTHLLNPFLHAGLVTLTQVQKQAHFPSWYYHQVLLANDCLHRSAALADWTFFHDFDEFLHVPPPNTLRKLLADNREAPWVTFGSLPVSHSHCLTETTGGASGLWPIQRMWWRHRLPECMHPVDPWTCTEAPGRRKYAVNPTKVSATGVHRVSRSAPGGVDLNASVARIHHYHGVLAPQVELCHHQVNLSQPITHLDWLMPGFAQYVQDPAIAHFVGEARSMPLL